LVVILFNIGFHSDERSCVGWKVDLPSLSLIVLIKDYTSNEMRKDFCTPALALDAQLATTSAANARSSATFLAANTIAL
jgi:hypothetical protein